MTESYLQLSFDGLIENQNKTFFSSACFNGLVEVDNETNVAKIIRRFPKENIFMYLLHHRLYKIGKEIIFAPDLAKNIHVMDMDSKELICLDFKIDDKYNSRCVDSYLWNNKLWMFFSNRRMPITSMDLVSHEIKHYPELTEPLKAVIDNEDSVVFWSELWKDYGQVYGVLYDSEYIIHIDLKHMKTDIYSVAPIGARLANIAVNDGIAYLTEFDSYEVILYSLKDGNAKKYVPSDALDLEKGTGYLYSNIMAKHGNIILVPNYDKRILCVRNGEIRYFCDMPELYRDITEDGRSTWRRFYSSELNGEIIRLFPAKANMFLEINLMEERAKGRSYQMPSEWINTDYYSSYVTTYVRESVQDSECMLENKTVNLKDYIRVLKSMEL